MTQAGDAIVLKCDDTFLVADAAGDVPADGSGLGLFYRDTRYLSRYELTLENQRLIALSSQHGGGAWVSHVLENTTGPDTDEHTNTHQLAIQRYRSAGDGSIGELLVLTSYALQSTRWVIELRFEADFADIFSVRNLSDHVAGEPLPVRLEDSRVCVGRRGEDGWERRIELSFSPAPTHLCAQCARFELMLEPRQSARLQVNLLLSAKPAGDAAAGPSVNGDAPAPRRRPPDPSRLESAAPHGQELLDAAAQLSAHPVLDRIVRRSLLDLSLLRGTLGRDLHYIAGGVPWYVTLFGRDSAVSALQVCAFHARLAGETLKLLAHYQAHARDEFRAAEPGKILHELRRGQLSHLQAIPQSPAYYGSVDSTLLFIILLEEYIAWSGDLTTLRELRTSLAAALQWIDEYADSDGDGYVDYGARQAKAGRYRRGLNNQGWKDSGDAICNADGSLVTPPVALCEVQGYQYRAWQGAARLLQLLEEPVAAGRLEQRAHELQQRFERDFWSEELGCYLLARQQGGRPAAVVSSNAGQVLWSGISSPEHASAVVARLLQPDMFSGWGVRTLSSAERRYNPMSYHLGSVWPHDNSLLCSGFMRYGAQEAALRLFDALFDAASGFRDHRLPELYCGFDRRAEERHPVHYPVACSPQAWAAGAVPYALTSLLGLAPDAPRGVLHIRHPCLPSWLERLSLRRVQVGQARVDLTFERAPDSGVRVDAHVTSGQLRVIH